MFRAVDAAEAEALPRVWPHAATYRETKPTARIERRARRRRANTVAIEPGIGSGRAESIDDKIKASIRVECGLRNTDNLIAPPKPHCPDEQPTLPSETRREERQTRQRPCSQPLS